MGKPPNLQLEAAVVQDNMPVMVIDKVYVGSAHAAYNADGLKMAGVTHVLDLTGNAPVYPLQFTYLSVPIRDKEHSNLLSTLPTLMIFIKAAIKFGKVLIHCKGGRSRSPGTAIAYLMIEHGYSFASAAHNVKERRSVMALNTGFETQLKALEGANGDVWEATQSMLRNRLTTFYQSECDEKENAPSPELRKSCPGYQEPMTPPSLTSKQDQERVLSLLDACDTKGMLHGSVPCGFMLSIPRIEGTSENYFIPTIQSMGTLVGCRCCNTHLFCTSAILQKQASIDKRDAVVVRSKCTTFSTTDGCSIEKNVSMSVMKLPQSLSRRVSIPSKVPRLSKLNVTSLMTTISSTPSKVLGTSDAQGNVNKTQYGQTNESSHSVLSGSKNTWRNFMTLNKKVLGRNKRIEKDLETLSEVVTENSSSTQPPPPPMNMANTTKVENDRNVDAWRNSYKDILRSSGTIECTEELKSSMDSVLIKDLASLPHFLSEHVLIEAQKWFSIDAKQASNGTINCPNEACRAALGDWSSQGQMSEWGENIQPAFRMQTHAVKILGNVLTRPRIDKYH